MVCTDTLKRIFPIVINGKKLYTYTHTHLLHMSIIQLYLFIKVNGHDYVHS